MKNLISTTLLLVSIGNVHANKISPHDLHVMDIQTKYKANIEAIANKSGGPATYVTVGFTNDCDYRLGATKIQDAIDFAEANGTNEVRVAQGTYNESIVIDDFDLALRGNFVDCAAAEANTQSTSTTSTVVSPSTPATVASILGNANSNTVTIERIRFSGGELDGFTVGSGLMVGNADVVVTLDNVILSSNKAYTGGGLYVWGSSPSSVTGRNLSVANNDAQSGGGIYCRGATNSVILNGESSQFNGINGNDTIPIGADLEVGDGNGGGVYVTDGCRFTNYVGSNDLGAFGIDKRGIQFNDAINDGGGIYASDGAIVNLIGYQFCFFECFGYNTEPVSIRYNSADSDSVGGGDGGGIYATGANTAVNVHNGYITNNDANRGGGIYIEDTANFFTNSTLEIFGIFGGPGVPTDCWSPGACNQIARNEANSNGGALYAISAATADINRTHIQGNRADRGTAVYTTDADTDVELEGALITGNGNNSADGFLDENVIRAWNGSRIELAWSTVADNNIQDANEIVANDVSTTRVVSTIIHENNAVSVFENSSAVSAIWDCVLVHEDASITGGFLVNVDDPSFVDRANGDYHIDFNASPAMDYCDSFSTPDFTDSDNDQRGWDWSGIVNVQGPYDVGYDEQNDLIFYNGFEEIVAP